MIPILYIYIYIHTYIHTYIHIWKHKTYVINIDAHTHIYIYKYTRIYTNIYIYIDIHINIAGTLTIYPAGFLPSPAHRLSGQVGNRPPGHQEWRKTSHALTCFEKCFFWCVLIMSHVSFLLIPGYPWSLLSSWNLMKVHELESSARFQTQSHLVIRI